MIIVGVIDEALLSIWGYDDRRNPRSVTEEVNWLYVAGIIVAAVFVRREHYGGVREQRTVADNRVRQGGCVVLVRRQARVPGVTIIVALRVNDRDRRQRVIRDIGVDLARVGPAQWGAVIVQRNAVRIEIGPQGQQVG